MQPCSVVYPRNADENEVRNRRRPFRDVARSHAWPRRSLKRFVEVAGCRPRMRHSQGCVEPTTREECTPVPRTVGPNASPVRLPFHEAITTPVRGKREPMHSAATLPPASLRSKYANTEFCDLVRDADAVLASPCQQLGVPYLVDSTAARPQNPSGPHGTTELLELMVGRLIDGLYRSRAGLNEHQG